MLSNDYFLFNNILTMEQSPLIPIKHGYTTCKTGVLIKDSSFATSVCMFSIKNIIVIVKVNVNLTFFITIYQQFPPYTKYSTTIKSNSPVDAIALFKILTQSNVKKFFLELLNLNKNDSVINTIVNTFLKIKLL